MMKRLIILCFTSLLLFSSCKKFLEQPPYNNVSLEDIFKDFEGARTTLVGLYDRLKSTNYYLLDFYAYPELAGGNIKYSRSSNQYMFFSYSFTRDSINNELQNFYTQAYNVIYGANNILQNIDKAADANSFQKARLLADAYTIRAIVHFDLVRTFAQPYNFTTGASHPGVVLKTFNAPVLTPTPPAATVKQVYDQVLKDLDTAISLYARSVSIFNTTKTFLSADAAKAIKNRVSLYKDDWATVVSTANELISSGQYPLTPNSQFVASWSKKNIASESIFELAFGNNIGGSYGDYFNPANTLRSQFAASNDLLTLYSAGDVRGQNSLYVPVTITGGTTYYYTRKYQGMNDSANNIKIIRLSEIYLNRAEAHAKLNNLTAALADLNTIRKRANPAAADFSSNNQQVVIDEILTERRRELAFEGHLFFDVARNKKNLVRVDATATINSFTYPNPLFAYPNRLFSDKKEIYETDHYDASCVCILSCM